MDLDFLNNAILIETTAAAEMSSCRSVKLEAYSPFFAGPEPLDSVESA